MALREANDRLPQLFVGEVAGVVEELLRVERVHAQRAGRLPSPNALGVEPAALPQAADVT